MSRSGRWRRRRPSEWSRTARTGHWRVESITGGAAPLSADGTSELTDGIVVRTQLLGRLLGLRLLRIDGTVLVSPAHPVNPSRPAPARPAEPARAAGSDLAEAARLLRENQTVLDRRSPFSVS